LRPAGSRFGVSVGSAETGNRTGPALEELLVPVHADFARSRMTQRDLLGLGRELLDKVRAEKKD